MRKVNSAQVFTSYANLEIQLVVNSFKVNLQEKQNPLRFPMSLYRDDEMKTLFHHYRHQCVQVFFFPLL